MAQTKKKQATKTAKKQTRSSKAASSRRCGSKVACKTKCSNRERNHIYVVTVMGMVAALLLCANAAMMMVI